MRELLELNRYAHDFGAALWVSGSLLLWLLCREVMNHDPVAEARRALLRFAGKLSYLTVPALVIALASGGVRALTFRKYEYVGEITQSLITLLIVKHVLFLAVIGWGIGMHVRARRLDVRGTGESQDPVRERPLPHGRGTEQRRGA